MLCYRDVLCRMLAASLALYILDGSGTPVTPLVATKRLQTLLNSPLRGKTTLGGELLARATLSCTFPSPSLSSKKQEALACLRCHVSAGSGTVGKDVHSVNGGFYKGGFYYFIFSLYIFLFCECLIMSMC